MVKSNSGIPDFSKNLDDYASFNRMFMQYYGRLCAHVYEITKSHTASEDIVQELFTKLWINRHKIEIRENIMSYLFKSSRNAALNYLRGETSRKKSLENITFEKNSGTPNHLEEEEFVNFLEECIDELPGRVRQVFRMSRFDDLKHKEIAEKLDISVKTIKNQIWKSLQYLKSCLELKEVL